MSRKLTLATVAALAAVGAFAAASLGGEGGNRPDDFNRSFERIGLQPVDAPSASASAGAQVAKGKPKAKYFESQSMPVTGPGADFSASCPGGTMPCSSPVGSTHAHCTNISFPELRLVTVPAPASRMSRQGSASESYGPR